MSIKRRSQITGQFAARTIEMLESPAYRMLSLSAHRIISRIEIELAHHGGKDNGKLPVTYDDFESYGVHRHAIAPAIKEAVALGFIEVTEHGRSGNAEHRTPNLFRLTFKPSKGYMGHSTNEWAKIPDIETAERMAKEARTPSPRKTFPSAGKRQIPVAETTTGSVKSIVRNPPLQAIVRNPPPLSISRVGVQAPSPTLARPRTRFRPPMRQPKPGERQEVVRDGQTCDDGEP
jgi:hypothetical protein